MERDDAKPGNAAVHRALGILRCFVDGPPERRLSDLARQAGLSVSPAHRPLAALTEATGESASIARSGSSRDARSSSSPTASRKPRSSPAV